MMKPAANSWNLAVWEQGASCVMYCLVTCVQDHMLSYIRDADTPKAAWDNLKRLFTTCTLARKLQLR